MATQNKTTYQATVDSLAPDNSTGEISESDVRTLYKNLSDSVNHTGAIQTLADDPTELDCGSFENRDFSFAVNGNIAPDIVNTKTQGFYKVNVRKDTANDVTITPTCSDVSDIFYESDDSTLTLKGPTNTNFLVLLVRISTRLYVFAPQQKKILQEDLLDEDDFASNSATKPASQQSIKAYADSKLGGKNLDTTITAPTATEDGYAVTWNNTNNEYELVPGGGAEWDAAATFTGSSGTEIQNDSQADITGQTSTAAFTFLDVDILNTGRSASGDVKFINFSDDSTNVFWVSANGSVTAGGATGDPYLDVANDSFGFVGDTDTGLRRTNANEVSLYTNGSARLKVFNDGGVEHQTAGQTLRGSGTGAFELMNETASATNPTIVPYKGDQNTGIGGDGSDSLSLIVGGTEAVNIASNGKLGLIEQAGSGPSIHGNSDPNSGVSFDSNEVTLSVANDAKISCFSNRIEIDERFRLNEYAEFAVQGADPSSLAGAAIVYAKDSSDGTTNATLAMQLEQSVEAIGTFTASHKLKVWINGTEYWIQLDAV